MKKLTGAEYQELQKALLSAFRSNDELTRLVRFHLGENLAAIVAPGALASVVFELIQWAESRGRLGELIDGALKENPGNPTLREFAARLGLSSPPTPPVPEPRPGRTKNNPPELFYSYSHKDEKLRESLETHLKLLQRQGIIKGWHDRKLIAGQEWEKEILSQLERADIILLLVSADFIASDFCYSTEMQRALERQATGDALVIPVILRPCDWKDAPFSKLQALPKDAKPVTSWGNRDEAFVNVAQGLRAAIQAWLARP